MSRMLQRYKKLFGELKQSAPRPIYFLYGPEEHIKREFISELIKRALNEETRSFNLDLIQGDEFDRELFHDRVSTFPLFTERRVVVLRRFEALSTPNKDFVIENVARLPESLVFVAETSKEKMDTVRMKKLQKLAEARGVSFRFQYLTDDEVIERARAHLHREGLSIEPDALDLLIQSVGTHLSDLLNELEKIVLAAVPGQPITRDRVAEVVGKYRTENVFSFLDQLGHHDIGRLLRQVNRVIDSGEEPVFVSAMLLRRVIQLIEVKALLRDEGARLRNAAALASRLSGPMSPFFAGRLLEQCKRFDMTNLDGYLNNLRWVDYRLKSTSLSARCMIETALLASSLGKNLAASTN